MANEWSKTCLGDASMEKIQSKDKRSGRSILRYESQHVKHSILDAYAVRIRVRGQRVIGVRSGQLYWQLWCSHFMGRVRLVQSAPGRGNPTVVVVRR